MKGALQPATSFDMTAPRCLLVRPAAHATAEPASLVDQLPRHGIDLHCLHRDVDIDDALHEQAPAAVLLAAALVSRITRPAPPQPPVRLEM